MKTNDEVDMTFVKMAQEHYRSDPERRKRLIEKSLHSGRQELKGETYVGRTQKIQDFLKTAVSVTALAAILIVGAKALGAQETLDSYQVQYQKEIGSENTSQQKVDNLLIRMGEQLDVLSQIQEEKDSLKETGQYGFFDANQLQDQAIQNVAEQNAREDIQESTSKGGRSW